MNVNKIQKEFGVFEYLLTSLSPKNPNAKFLNFVMLNSLSLFKPSTLNTWAMFDNIENCLKLIVSLLSGFNITQLYCINLTVEGETT